MMKQEQPASAPTPHLGKKPRPTKLLSKLFVVVDRLAEEEALAERRAESEHLQSAEGKLEEKLRLQKMEENANLVKLPFI